MDEMILILKIRETLRSWREPLTRRLLFTELSVWNRTGEGLPIDYDVLLQVSLASGGRLAYSAGETHRRCIRFLCNAIIC